MFHLLPLFLLLCFFCVQRYCKYLYLPNILPKIFVFLTVLNYKVCILKILIHILSTN